MNILITFPGQGSQSAKMLEESRYLPDSLISSYLESLDSIGINLPNIIETEPDLLNQTTVTQPVILGLSYITYQHFMQFFKQHDVTLAGHSLGELTAACIAFNLPLKQSVKLAQERAELMELSMRENNIKTATIALLGSYTNEAQDIVQSQKQVWAINFNSTSQTILTGSRDAIENASKLLQELPTTKRIISIPMSVSSHCPLLQEVTPAWSKILNKAFAGKSINYSVASNVTATIHHEPEKVIQNLEQALTHSVLYYRMIENLMPKDLVVELGPGKVLTNLNKRISRNFQALSANEIENFTENQNFTKENVAP